MTLPALAVIAPLPVPLNCCDLREDDLRLVMIAPGVTDIRDKLLGGSVADAEGAFDDLVRRGHGSHDGGRGAQPGRADRRACAGQAVPLQSGAIGGPKALAASPDLWRRASDHSAP